MRKDKKDGVPNESERKNIEQNVKFIKQMGIDRFFGKVYTVIK